MRSAFLSAPRTYLGLAPYSEYEMTFFSARGPACDALPAPAVGSSPAPLVGAPRAKSPPWLPPPPRHPCAATTPSACNAPGRARPSRPAPAAAAPRPIPAEVRLLGRFPLRPVAWRHRANSGCIARSARMWRTTQSAMACPVTSASAEGTALRSAQGQRFFRDMAAPAPCW
eukprot:scaffold9124_cov101-Isochrysis_galbana.AAC.2